MHRHAQVVRRDHHAYAQLPLQGAQQDKDLGLHGGVQRLPVPLVREGRGGSSVRAPGRQEADQAFRFGDDRVGDGGGA